VHTTSRVKIKKDGARLYSAMMHLLVKDRRAVQTHTKICMASNKWGARGEASTSTHVAQLLAACTPPSFHMLLSLPK
jgi:hypothetical protein